MQSQSEHEKQRQRMLKQQKASSVVGSSKSNGSTLSPTDGDSMANGKRAGKTCRGCNDNRQLMKWKAYMKSVTAKVSSRWTTGDKVSYQSADMMKYKEVSSKPEGSSQKQDSPGSDSQESDLARVRSANRDNRSKPWSERKLPKRSSRASSAATARPSAGHVGV
ncbi:hypothetical protein EB796_014835 [Bugula neritina]|uniref:Uncharacterized protein n=1 Tax=Bugula neritina TaxID=10212 RepID=A0A7J7JMI2_BUGNE|nr:hypothetical protein EB796_014835 [Bugula neritina]